MWITNKLSHNGKENVERHFYVVAIYTAVDKLDNMAISQGIPCKYIDLTIAL